MFKKFLCLLLLVILTSTVTLSAFAVGCDNPQYNHGTRYARADSEKTSYTYVNTSSHRKETVTYYVCTMCEAIGYGSFWTSTTSTTEAHVCNASNDDDVDGGHVPGTHSHRRNKHCSICNARFSTTYQCPGPPCPVYLSEAMLETE